jgi:cytochrome c oxidase subunit 2
MRNGKIWAAVLLTLWLTGCATQPDPAAEKAAAIERGRVLFVNKGCAACHHNNRVDYAGYVFDQQVNLSNYRGEPAFLRQWLANPTALRPTTTMPNLQLSPTEIDDLIVFLNEGTAPR